ncbi:TonB-dependent receptor [Novosphingobium mangrovi (ex Hu et al. 2023)]|uniref:TonB-dependent receptor n=1 Tax=Novosphingobium mangrovi (ex Hu et al. 2023) TaxID=2930094 RepID=A0ABT0ACR2_9SPHN|nr:TonB-dependent receptor [Novosphingobium mangrovi (ex Hu et al. 2023)]MCJ1960985.1 TonB-dependent receptor [Novosphingobium mangrovi (ex Hu et al. 2023)]
MAAFITTLFGATGAHAQEAAETPGSETRGNDIVVTASRREQRLIDVPMSISALQQEDLDRQGVTSMHDLSRAVPDLVVVEAGPGQNRVFMRGIANGNSLTSLVGVYLDEIPVTGSSLGQPDLQMIDLERVEVLRGPQGTLYGQGSAGGTLRFITAKPDTTRASGAMEFTGYDTRYGDFSEKMTGHLNVPVVDDTFAVRVAGTLANIGGWIDQPDAGRSDINDQLMRHIRAKALWQASADLTIEGTVVVHRNEGHGVNVGADGDYDVYYPGGDPEARQSFRDDYTIYNGTLTYDFGGVQLLSSTSWMNTTRHNVGAAQKIVGVETFLDDSIGTKSFTQEARLSSTDAGPLHWVVGGFYTNEKLDRDLDVTLYTMGLVIESPSVTRQSSETISAFGDVSYDVTSALQLGVGLRYFHDTRHESNAALSQEGKFHSVNPRFYANLRVSEDVTIYANIAKGFRSGGFLGDADLSTYDPETVWSYELGTKGELGPVSWELAGYYSQYQDYQTFVMVSAVYGGVTNAGDAEVYGLDASLSLEPVSGLTLAASGNYTHTELTEVDAATVTNIAGDPLDFVPKYTVTGSAEYRFALTDSLPAFARVDFSQIGKSTITDRSYGLIRYPSDELSLLSARLGIAAQSWKFEIFANNLLNENGLQDPMAAIGLDTRAKPRTIGFTIGKSF